MNDLSLTQQYLLCVLNNKGRIPMFGIEKTMCVVASGIVELLLDDILELEEKKLAVKRELPVEKSFLRPVYHYVEKRQPVKFEKVIENFSITFTDKNINELIDCIGESLEKAGCVHKENGGRFSDRSAYIPEEKAVDRIVQNIRAEFLEEGELTEEVVALATLLNKSGELTKYFSAYEKKDLKKRLKEIKDNPQNKEIQRVTDYIDTLLLMLVIAAT